MTFAGSSVATDHMQISPSVLYFGTPVVLLCTRNPEGMANITPMSSAWALGATVALGLSPASQGAANLLREGECTLNFPAADLWPRIEQIARTTGRDPVPAYKAKAGFRHEADKFTLGGFTAQASEVVKTPRIAECPLQFEAALLACHNSAAPQSAGADPHLIIEVEVRRVHARRDIVIPGTSHINTDQWNPLLYVFRHYFGDAARLGRNFRAET